MPTITFANNKGGVAKTTSTIMTGLALCKRGLKVEVKDLDPSRDATEWAQTTSGAGTPSSVVAPANMRNVDAQSGPDIWVLTDAAGADADRAGRHRRGQSGHDESG